MAIPLRKPSGDSWNDGPSGRGPGWNVQQLRLWSVTTWLIIINVAVFVIDRISHNRFADSSGVELERLLRAYGPAQGMVLYSLPTLTRLGHFSESLAISHLQIWRFITFQFLHANGEHLFFNMLSLYFFGTYIEGFLGKAKYLAFYLICGIAGALGYLLLWRMGTLVSSPYLPLVGASAGIFGVLVGAAHVAPNLPVQLMFPPITLRMRTLAWIFVAIAIGTIVVNGENAGGEAAHLGGAVAGVVLIRNPGWLSIFHRPRKKRSRFWRPGDPPSKFFREG